MATEFRTNCGETFNRLEFVVHDLHKILHHRVSKNFKFNIITFGHTTHKWHEHMQTATKSNLKAAGTFSLRISKAKWKARIFTLSILL